MGGETITVISTLLARVGGLPAGLSRFRRIPLSHGLGLIDALIGATAVGWGETLATFNVKHFAVIAGLTTVQPY